MPHEALGIESGNRLVAPGGVRDVRVTALSIVFVVSGFCGLIYEALWSHYLKLFVGHAAYAQTVVLVVFIGGMALGAWLIGRVSASIRSPLVAYAVVEAAIGAISLVFHPLFVGLTGWGYATLLPAACAAESACLAQWGLAAAMILPQSILLGTTFPLMTAGVLRLEPHAPGRSIAWFYFLNSIGAVAGVLASAFLLIPALGLPGALTTAGLLNVAVAIAAYACSKTPAGTTTIRPRSVAAADDAPAFRRLLLVVAALTGLSSFVYEIIWIRMLSLVIGASTDAFELMLAAFILGLALGGLWVRKRVDRFADLLVTLAIVQVLMGAAAALTLPLYDHTFDLLSWLLSSMGRTAAGYALYNLASHGVALLVMLPATFLAGMTLPLITTALLRGRHGESAIGYVYASNTLGAIVGVLVTVHFLLPVLGIKGALLTGAAIDVALALVLFHWHRASGVAFGSMAWWLGGVGVLLGVAVLVPVSLDRIASGVYRHGGSRLPATLEVVFHRDGKTASVDVVRGEGSLSIRTNGKSDAAIATDPTKPAGDEYTMAFTAVLPLAYRPQTEYAAVIGFGSGMTTATLLGSPNLKRVDTIEIEPEMVEGARLFGATVSRAYDDPRSRIVIDDAKSYFARSSLRYDTIISEPSNPWVSGVASLFTAEFYRQVKRQLSDEGVFVQWIQAYEFSDVLLATIMRALDQEFADYAVYAANESDMIVIASNRPLPSVSDAFTRFAGLRGTSDRLAMNSVADIELRRLAGASTVRAWLATLAPGINSDYFPLVDLGAPRERFLRTQARALLDLPNAPVPVVEMLEYRLPVKLEGATDAPDHRRAAVRSAVATAGWLVDGTHADSDAKLPRDIGLLRAALWQCANLPPRVGLRDLMYDVAELNPELSHAITARVWATMRGAPCADRMTSDDRAWLALFAAVASRDAHAMGDLGPRLLGSPDLPPHLRAYALMAGATGLIVSGRSQQAAEFLDRTLQGATEKSRSDPVLHVLRGYAARQAMSGNPVHVKASVHPVRSGSGR